MNTVAAHRFNILVVDDENGPRQAIRILLKEEHNVFTADCVAAGRQIILDESIDLVITDLRMPHESGISLVEWIQAHYPEIEVIILTGYGQLDTAMKAVEFGAFAYLEKPFDNTQLIEQIQRALDRRIRELDRRRLELLALEANRFETLGRFVSGMLHDLSTPLSVINSYIELIQTDPERKNLERKLDVMQTQTKHCSDVVRSAMNFLRHESSRLVALSMNEVIHACLGVSMPVLFRQEVTVERNLAEELPPCQGDFVLVRQAILNLITNAAQAMEGQEEPAELHITTAHDGKYINVSVRDTGPGIPEEMRDRVCDTFFTTKGHKGTGLGLAAVFHIMKRHGGFVEFQKPEEGRGEQVFLRFPIERPTF